MNDVVEPWTDIETDGGTDLAYFTYFVPSLGRNLSDPAVFDLVNGTSAYLRYNNQYVHLGDFGAWTPIGAERSDANYFQVAWKNGSADQYTVWYTDLNGNYVLNTAVMAIPWSS